jgi:hypothetical protein
MSRNNLPSFHALSLQLLNPLIEHVFYILRVRIVTRAQNHQLGFHRSFELRFVVEQFLEALELCCVSG